ncbi:hypothetical protein POKO110462_13240 [Pontibacter korlensis]
MKILLALKNTELLEEIRVLASYVVMLIFLPVFLVTKNVANEKA